MIEKVPKHGEFYQHQNLQVYKVLGVIANFGFREDEIAVESAEGKRHYYYMSVFRNVFRSVS